MRIIYVKGENWGRLKEANTETQRAQRNKEGLKLLFVKRNAVSLYRISDSSCNNYAHCRKRLWLLALVNLETSQATAKAVMLLTSAN